MAVVLLPGGSDMAGKKGVRFTTINKICYYLHCDVGDILSFDGNLDEGCMNIRRDR